MTTLQATLPQRPADPIRVFLADDHRSTLWGLERLIESAAPRTALAGSATSKRELLERVPAARPDVVVLDLDLAGESGADCIPLLAEQVDSRVLVLTGMRDQNAHEDAVLRGARGVVRKEEPAESIIQAIEKVHQGEIWVPRATLQRIVQSMAAKPKPRRDPDAERIGALTPRERDVIAAVVAEKGSKSCVIAERLGMSEHTLRNHLTEVYNKLGVHGRLELFIYATGHGLDRPRE